MPPDIGMSHEILQTYHINAALLHIRTEGMPQNMRRRLWKGISVNSTDLLLDTSHVVLQVHSNLCHTGLIKKDKIAITVYDPFQFADRPILHNPLQGQINGIRHGNCSHTAGQSWEW